MAQGPILLVVGARPFLKIAPLRSLIHRNVPTLLLHTGQHYDENMSGVFFEDLNMRPPDIHLDVVSATNSADGDDHDPFRGSLPGTLPFDGRRRW